MNLTYATIPGSPAPGIRVALQDADGATAWDFRIVDRSWMYDGTPMIAVEITHDAFGVFVDARPLLPAGMPGLGEGPTVQLWPHRHGTDAMFVQLLSKVDA